MSIPLFDCFSAYGGRPNPKTPAVTRAELIEEMDRLAIGRALVRSVHIASGVDFVERNNRLLADCANDSRLVPCGFLVPSGGGDVPAEDRQVDALIRGGARAVWIRPAKGCYTLSETVTGPMFRAAAERRLPVVCHTDFIPLADVEILLRRHPGVRLIVIGSNYRDLGVIRPLLIAFPDLYLSLGRACAAHELLECLAAAQVLRQVVFGTGFPDAEPMMAVTALMYADISAEDRRLVGAGNLERLISEVAV